MNSIDDFNSDFTGLAFADPKDHKQNKHHDPRLYVNTLSYNNANFMLLDSCDNLTDPLPCLKIDPFSSGDDSEIFIADPALQSTRTAISVTILEQNEFQPDDVYSSPYVVDAFSGVTSITVSTFNDVRGVFVTFDRVIFEEVGEKIFDITYTFIETPVDEEDDTCDCDKPSNLFLQYNGPLPETDLAVEIYKKEGEVGDSNKLLGTVLVDGGVISLHAEDLTSGKDTLEANTVFRVMNSTDDTQIAVLSIHTSCSKPLFIGDEITSNAGEDNMVSLIVLDGTDTTGNTSIPAASCSDE